MSALTIIVNAPKPLKLLGFPGFQNAGADTIEDRPDAGDADCAPLAGEQKANV